MMTDFDDLLGEDEFDFDDSDNVIGDDEGEATLFLGMTPVERMFLSIFLFLNVLVLGIGLLMVSGRIG